MIMRYLLWLGSYRFTLYLIGFLAVAILLFVNGLPLGREALWTVFGAVTLNLAAAVLFQEAFREKRFLQLAHLSMLAFLVLVGLSRMSALDGTLELAEGESFDGTLEMKDAAPWHRDSLAGLQFTNLGVRVDYLPGVKRNNTETRISYQKDGNEVIALVGDQHPLVLDGYRFYTTHNKGFTAVFSLSDEDRSEPVLGAVNFPAFPAHEYEQVVTWRPEGTQSEVWTQLKIEESVLHEDSAFVLSPPNKHHLVIRLGDERTKLGIGDSVVIDGIELRYLGLRMWMGFKVFYDWTRPWLLASLILGITSLLWHFIVKIRGRDEKLLAVTS